MRFSCVDTLIMSCLSEIGLNVCNTNAVTLAVGSSSKVLFIYIFKKKNQSGTLCDVYGK